MRSRASLTLFRSLLAHSQLSRSFRIVVVVVTLIALSQQPLLPLQLFCIYWLLTRRALRKSGSNEPLKGGEELFLKQRIAISPFSGLTSTSTSAFYCQLTLNLELFISSDVFRLFLRAKVSNLAKLRAHFRTCPAQCWQYCETSYVNSHNM